MNRKQLTSVLLIILFTSSFGTLYASAYGGGGGGGGGGTPPPISYPYIDGAGIHLKYGQSFTDESYRIAWYVQDTYVALSIAVNVFAFYSATGNYELRFTVSIRHVDKDPESGLYDQNPFESIIKIDKTNDALTAVAFCDDFSTDAGGFNYAVYGQGMTQGEGDSHLLKAIELATAVLSFVPYIGKALSIFDALSFVANINEFSYQQKSDFGWSQYAYWQWIGSGGLEAQDAWDASANNHVRAQIKPISSIVSFRIWVDSEYYFYDPPAGGLFPLSTSGYKLCIYIHP